MKKQRASCLSSVLGLLRGEKKIKRREKKKEPKTEKKETWRPNFTNSQTDTGYMGEGGTAAAHSRRGRDVSEW